MARSKNKAKPEYELKHRLTGAAIMVAFAVIFIPLLLKDPGIEANVVDTSGGNGSKKTFKTSIEPLNLNTLTLSREEDDPGDDAQNLKPALLQSEEVVAFGESISQTPAQNLEIEPAPAAVVEQTTAKTTEPSQESTKKVALAAETQKQPEPVVTSEPEPEPEPKQITEAAGVSGWTVRVGTYTKQKNAETVSDKLNSSGFNTHHTSVTTTLGPATRVWLGPYEKKETAEKVSARLKSLLGEKGYVTKHAS